MTDSTVTPLVDVIQADREAAANLFAATPWSRVQFVSGKRDRLDLVQAFARHRIEQIAQDEDTYKMGIRDGYEEATQDIDLLTGGDGEYFASTLPSRGCEDAGAMKRGIEVRFAAKDERIARLEAALRDLLRLADMGFEQSMNEPEEDGNYVAYTRARAALNEGTASS